MTQYSIVVDNPEPNNTIFVARPFSDDFNKICDLILRAIAAVKFTYSGTDLNPEDVSFKVDIVKKIRGARIVVAVCSQESETKKPNPNVMYELGFARSIGKPSVVLMRKGENLPADLQGDQIVFYELGLDKEDEIVKDLTNKLFLKIDHSKETRLIDEVSYKNDIWVGYVHNWLILKPNLWNDFLIILRFAKKVHELFYDISSSHINFLHAGVRIIGAKVFVDPVLQIKKDECATMWENYIRRYNTAEKDFLRDITKTQDTVEKKASELRKNISDTITDEKLESVQNYLNQLEEFSKTHADIVDKVVPRRGFDSIFDTDNSVKQIIGLLGYLSLICHGLTSNSDSLIKDLTDLLLETEG